MAKSVRIVRYVPRVSVSNRAGEGICLHVDRHGRQRQIFAFRSWGRCFASCLLAALGSCDILGTEEFVDFDDYALLPRLLELDFSNVNMREDIVYWELRESFPSQDYLVRASGGVMGRDGLDPLVLDVFDTISTDLGFAPSCLPRNCLSHIASVSESGDVEVWETPQRVQELLTPIESVAEAALQVLSFGYYWTGVLETSAYRTVPIGFEMIMIRLGANCVPVQVQLGLTEVADIFVLKQRALRLGNGCVIWGLLAFDLRELVGTGVQWVRGCAYSRHIAVTGGNFLYHWSIKGGSLPPGLFLVQRVDGSADLVGTLTAAGVFRFTLVVESGDGQRVTSALTITVTEPLPGQCP